MKAELKRINCHDATIDLPTYVPEIADNFGFSIDLMTGPDGADSEEIFSATICTPKWIDDQHGTHDIVVGRHYFIVFEYNYKRLVQQLNHLVSSCTGDTWHEVAEKVGRLASWEFEDYQPYKYG